MTLLCLFVVLGALFITVLNSRTVDHVSTSDSVVSPLPKEGGVKKTELGMETQAPLPNSTETAFSQKEHVPTAFPTLY